MIDWDTARVDGYPFFDLVRAARSFGVSRPRLARVLAAHRQRLGWRREDARGALAAAFGHLGNARENFPLERYAQMCQEALATFDATE